MHLRSSRACLRLFLNKASNSCSQFVWVLSPLGRSSPELLHWEKVHDCLLTLDVVHDPQFVQKLDLSIQAESWLAGQFDAVVAYEHAAVSSGAAVFEHVNDNVALTRTPSY